MVMDNPVSRIFDIKIVSLMHCTVKVSSCDSFLYNWPGFLENIFTHEEEIIHEIEDGNDLVP